LFGPARATSGGIDQFNQDPFSIFMKPGGSLAGGGTLSDWLRFDRSKTFKLRERRTAEHPSAGIELRSKFADEYPFCWTEQPESERSCDAGTLYEYRSCGGFRVSAPVVWRRQNNDPRRLSADVWRRQSEQGIQQRWRREGIFGNAPGATNVPTTAVADPAFQSILATRALTFVRRFLCLLR
jgi:hypothetical protein